MWRTRLVKQHLAPLPRGALPHRRIHRAYVWWAEVAEARRKARIEAVTQPMAHHRKASKTLSSPASRLQKSVSEPSLALDANVSWQESGQRMHSASSTMASTPSERHDSWMALGPSKRATTSHHSQAKRTKASKAVSAANLFTATAAAGRDGSIASRMRVARQQVRLRSARVHSQLALKAWAGVVLRRQLSRVRWTVWPRQLLSLHAETELLISKAMLAWCKAVPQGQLRSRFSTDPPARRAWSWESGTVYSLAEVIDFEAEQELELGRRVHLNGPLCSLPPEWSSEQLAKNIAVVGPRSQPSQCDQQLRKPLDAKNEELLLIVFYKWAVVAHECAHGVCKVQHLHVFRRSL